MTPSDDTNDPAGRHSDASPETRARSSTRVGRYLVLGVLARGGMGEVLRARAIGAAGATKEVCLKRIRASRLGDRHALERFVHEARLSLALTHANIVATFDFGRTGRDYYLAMEWIDGADLGRILRDAETKPLPAVVVAHVGAEMARALRYSHEGGVAEPGAGAHAGSRPAIVHCDVKPSNILVSRSGDVKLADFGVAVARLDESRGGTPRYMAPEVRDGGPAGPEADLFGLGVVLGEMAERAVDVPAELGSLVARLTAVDPASRPTAPEVLVVLEEAIARARLSGSVSPRDELGRRASQAAPTLDAPSGVAGSPSELEPDASYLRDGASELETRLTVTTRSTPAPPRPAPRAVGRNATLALGGLIVVLAIGVGVIRWGAQPTGEVALAPVPPVIEAGAGRTPTETLSPPPASSLSTTVQPSRPVEPSTPLQAPEAAPVVPSAEPQPAITSPAPLTPISSRARPERRSRTSAPEPAPPRTTAPLESPVSPPVAPADDEPATLRINAIPWANVELDGRALGATPLTHVELAPGSHTLVLTNPVLGRSRTERVDVIAGERRDVIVEMR